MSAPSAPSAVDVLTLLVSGPSINEVASTLLRSVFDPLYPQLSIDPALTLVVTPGWIINDQQITHGDPRFESLTDVLVRLALSGDAVTYIDGEHFLTLKPGVEPAIQLPVKIDAIGCLLNELAPVLFTAYQENQVDYWNDPVTPDHPRWYLLSDTLRNQWNIAEDNGWDADQRAMARAVFNEPDKARRLSGDKYKTRACLIDIDLGEATDRKHLSVLDTAVLIGTLGNRTLILTHSITQGFQRFDSFDALGQSLTQVLAGPNPGLYWRLFEPQGNYFDQQACTLIALEAEAIGYIDFFQSVSETGLVSRPGSAGNQEPPERLKPQFNHIEHALPQWLEKASPADQTCYSRHLLDLAVFEQQNSGKTFQREIPDIKRFTLNALAEQLNKKHPHGTDLKLDDIEISITSVTVWGTFVFPGDNETLTLSLVELALQNLVGLPPGNKTVRYKNGTAVPAWMTYDYVEKLISAVNIGATYPAMLKRRLVDDAAQASPLQRLYTRQLAIELPLLTLQNKIRAQADVDEQGYRYVLAALASEPADRQVDGQDIVIRPLAFVTGKNTGASADEVVNMFVIEPRIPDKGPCLLYRPLLDPPLLQYPSRANLLYAIHHSRSLRQSVLAWLPDRVRFNYSQYVFPGALPSVWTVPQLLIDPTVSPQMAGPVVLGGHVIEQDVRATLFKANARALITQADRQSVSNAEARWATLKRGGWMIFNAALPFLGRGIGTAAWIWQIMDDLQEVADSQEHPQESLAGSALADIFLTLGMVLAHRAAVRKKPRLAPSASPVTARTVEEKTPSTPSTPITAIRQPDLPTHELPQTHATSLHGIGALQRSLPALESFLDTLMIPAPQGLAEPMTEGPHKHLRAHGQQWYAKVGERWFEVILNDHEDVQIIDSRPQPPRSGPLLMSNVRGEWFVDLRLRLRGGGLKSRRKQVQRENQERLRKKKEEIAAFDASLEGQKTQLFSVRQAMLAATPDAVESARQRFLDELDSQLKAYSAHIENLKSLNVLEAIPNYRTAMLDRITLQLFLMQSWINEQYPVFRSSLGVTLELLDKENPTPQEERSEPFEKMTDQTQGIIDKLEFAQSRFEELSLLGKEGAEITRSAKAKLPTFDLQDLKLLQITLGQALCLKPGTTETLEQARQGLESLIEDAALNIQSSLDLSEDENLHNLGDRIEALNNLAEQFAIIDQRFLDLTSEYPEQLIQERLDQVQKRVAEFSQDTVQRLSNLLREQRLIDPVPGPSRSSSAPAKKIIKTRFKGTLVGKPRKDARGQDTDFVDVVAPLTGKVIATFHEKSPGVWVERVPAKPPAPPRATPDLSKSTQAGQNLLTELPAFRRRTEAHINRAQRIPTEIEEIYYLHAEQLNDAVKKIDQALSAGNISESRSAAATTLRNKLDSAAKALYTTGRSTRIAMTKQQAPTAARVEWLKGKSEIEIAKATQRRRLKGPRKDYLLEYEILDKQTQEVLWYAHFHYANPADPLPSFTAAHLKTVDQRRLGGAYEWRDPHSNQELIAIHRSEISRSLAQSLFFS